MAASSPTFSRLRDAQCMIERRTGGESGVVAVQCLEGDAVWQAGADGHWSPELATAACAPIPDKPEGSPEDHCENPAVFLLEHSDGFRSAILMLNGYISQFRPMRDRSTARFKAPSSVYKAGVPMDILAILA